LTRNRQLLLLLNFSAIPSIKAVELL